MSLSADNIIIGAGATGLSVARYLSANNLPFLMMDKSSKSKDILKEFSGTTLLIGEFDKNILQQAKRLIVSPGVPIQTEVFKKAQQSGVSVVGDIELFANAIDKSAKVAAVTGSNGKSTCVTLLYQMAKNAGLEVRLGGNIGTPALDLLDDKVALYILELSSFQLETTEHLDCDVSCVLNISPDHLDRYKNYQAYISAKKRLLKQSKQVVIFKDDALIQDWQTKQIAIHFTLNEPQENEYGIKNGWLMRGEDSLIHTDEIKLKGKHNQANALACLAMGHQIGLPNKAMFQTLRSFAGLPHRFEFVATINGVDWINDSKATNVGAVVAGLNGLDYGIKNVILLAGGQSKGADLSALKSAISPVKVAILFGEDADLIQQTIGDLVDCKQSNSLIEACQLAYKLAKKNDKVLLSPACASFDMFDNFSQRGEIFKQQVRAF